MPSSVFVPSALSLYGLAMLIVNEENAGNDGIEDHRPEQMPGLQEEM